jgi:hypothetical protein
MAVLALTLSLLLAVSLGVAANTWTSIGPSFTSRPGAFSGRVQAIAVDPTNADRWLIGAAGGGVWETLDAGTTWRPRTDEQASLAMGRIAIAPSNPTRRSGSSCTPTRGDPTTW